MPPPLPIHFRQILLLLMAKIKCSNIIQDENNIKLFFNGTDDLPYSQAALHNNSKNGLKIFSISVN